MSQKTILLRIFIALSFMVLVAACGPYMHQPMQSRRATLGPETPVNKELLGLPKPKEKIVIAVYKFRDQTGQYKASETGANWSTAVTQGATTILIKALEESGWFIPIERENIADLLNERKIIRMSRAQYEGGEDKNGNLLPPLLFAGVILEGGIISYETNILTGGAGIRYFGADASGQYREDRVSIYIRAVSSANGKVLKTVYTTKSILSQEISQGFFRYVKVQRLLEAETGFTYNEPTEMCVKEAIEKGVESLIIEGVEDKLWALDNPKDTTSVSFTNYQREKMTNYKSDPLGRVMDENLRGRVTLGVQVGTNTFSGDYSSGSLRPRTSLESGFAISRHLFLESQVGYRGLMVPKKVDDYSWFGDLSMQYVFLPYEKLTPYLRIGGGFDYNEKQVGLTANRFLPKLNGSFGLEYMARKNLGISVSSDYNYYLNDMFDGARHGYYDDGSWGFSIGLRLYFSGFRQNVAYF